MSRQARETQLKQTVINMSRVFNNLCDMPKGNDYVAYVLMSTGSLTSAVKQTNALMLDLADLEMFKMASHIKIIKDYLEDKLIDQRVKVELAKCGISKFEG